MEIVKPFVKWAGGKSSLIPQITKYFPFELKNGQIEKYVEPFVGGGAVLIDILQKYDVKQTYAFDINKDLIKETLQGILEPISSVLGTIKQGIQDTFSKFWEVYNTYIAPAVDNIKNGFSSILETVLTVWNENDLQLDLSSVGLNASPTKVVSTEIPQNTKNISWLDSSADVVSVVEKMSNVLNCQTL